MLSLLRAELQGFVFLQLPLCDAKLLLGLGSESYHVFHHDIEWHHFSRLQRETEMHVPLLFYARAFPAFFVQSQHANGIYI